MNGFAQWAIWGALMALAFFLIDRSRKRDMKRDFGRTLNLPAYVLVVGVLDFGMFAGFAVFSNLFPNDTVTIWSTLVFCAFASLGAYMLYAFAVERHSYDDEKLVYVRFSGAKRELRWDDVRSVRYTPSMQWFVLEDGAGKRYYLATILRGMKPFCALLKARVEPGRIHYLAHEALDKLAAGQVV